MRLRFENASFLTSCFKVADLNVPKRPEIVFVGRSNVGKSSMINALLSKKSLARVGETPGKTVSVNFFDVDGKVLFTDLPGYGYAKRSKAERRGWGGLIGDYLDADRDIRLIVLLVDSRHEPTDDDKLMYDYLMSRETLFCVAATKTDKLNKTELTKSLAALEHLYGIEPIPFSSHDKTGVDKLRQIIEDVTSEKEETV